MSGAGTKLPIKHVCASVKRKTFSCSSEPPAGIIPGATKDDSTPSPRGMGEFMVHRQLDRQRWASEPQMERWS
jgi:hypothetical protein